MAVNTATPYPLPSGVQDGDTDTETKPPITVTAGDIHFNTGAISPW